MIARNMFRGTGRLLVAGVILLGHGTWLAAQTAGGLPPMPDYRGEIRRGPDGKLMALPEPPVIETAIGFDFAPALGGVEQSGTMPCPKSVAVVPSDP